MDNQLESTRSAQNFRVSRLLIARICSGIGAMALIVAILAVLLQHDITAVVLISALIAIGGIGLWTILAPNDLKALVTGRQAFYGGNSIFVSIVVVGIVAVVYTVVNSSGVAVDTTLSGLYSLKRDIRPVVATLDQPLQITAFYTNRILNQLSNDRPTLRLFSDAAPDKVKLVIVDPDTQPLLARDFKLSGNFGIYVSYLDRTGKPDQTNTVQASGTYANQKWIAEAILKLEIKGKLTIRFTTGHGEVNTDAAAYNAQQNNAVAVRQGLNTQLGINTENIDLSNTNLPDNTAALVVVGPARDFTDAEVQKIAHYMANGGKLFLMAEPAYRGDIVFMTTDKSPMVAYLWDTWGIKPQHVIVYDPVSYNGNQYYVLPSVFAAHRILDKGSNTPIKPEFDIVQSWEINKTLPQNVVASLLLTSSDTSFGKPPVDAAAHPDAPRGPNDISGPLTLMAIAENSVNHSRLIVIGDTDWLLDANVTNTDNALLWTNSINWLTQVIDKVSVDPVAILPPLNTSTYNLNIVGLITLVVLPGTVLLAGLLIWINRSRHP